MSGKSLIWAFAMKSLSGQGRELPAAKAHEQYPAVSDVNALLKLSDLKSECRADIFEQINRALGSSEPPLKNGLKLKI